MPKLVPDCVIRTLLNARVAGVHVVPELPVEVTIAREPSYVPVASFAAHVCRTICFVTVVPFTVYVRVPADGSVNWSVAVPTVLRTTAPGLNGTPKKGPVVSSSAP